MVARRLVHGQGYLLAGRVSPVWLPWGDLEAGEGGIPPPGRIVDEKGAAFGKVGVKGQPQQPLFLAGRGHPIPDVQEGLSRGLALGVDPDQPPALHHKETPAAVPGVGDEDRLIQPGDGRGKGKTHPVRLEGGGLGRWGVLAGGGHGWLRGRLGCCHRRGLFGQGR